MTGRPKYSYKPFSKLSVKFKLPKKQTKSDVCTFENETGRRAYLEKCLSAWAWLGAKSKFHIF